jgi:hypothetical protein
LPHPALVDGCWDAIDLEASLPQRYRLATAFAVRLEGPCSRPD